jgi:HD-like signal output (HDOD) protein/CheY-like chemotaxis protein
MTRKPHVLFVDDEPEILEALRRMLRARRNHWDMTFANSGAAALEVLGDRHCDVVVVDLRMPGISGAALLERVRAMSPDTARIILSGQTDADNVMRVLTLAHLFLDKPVGPDQIVEAIERVLALREEPTSANEDVFGDISGIGSLPSPPHLLTQLLAVLDDDGAGASSIGQIIEGDPAIAAKILHLANSAAYTTGRQLGEVSQAVALLGTNTVRGLVMLHDIVDAFSEKVSLPATWLDTMNTHSVETARLASRFSAGKAWSSASFTAGLLHEVGQLVLATSRPDEFGKIMARWNETGEAAEAAAEGAPMPGAATSAAETAAPGTPPGQAGQATPALLCDLEIADIGTSHAVIGAKLLSLWGLPADIVEAAAQHATTELPSIAEDLCSAVILAHAVVEAELGALCGARPVRAIKEDELGTAERSAVQRWRASLQPPE